MIIQINTKDGIKDINTNSYEAWYDEYLDLNSSKEIKISTINTKTEILITDGFSYGNKIFGCDATDIQNYSGLLLKKDRLTQLNMYPYKVKCKCNSDYYEIQDADEMDTFTDTIFVYIATIRKSGWDLIDAVNDCDTIQCVFEVEDDR